MLHYIYLYDTDRSKLGYANVYSIEI